MRHGSQSRRSRNNRGHGGGGGNRQGGGPNRAQVFDSNGPDVRIRGTAFQIVEKYMALAKDAASAGDPVLAESYLQHAEHYQRIVNTWNEQSAQFQRSEPGQPQAVDGVDQSFRPEPQQSENAAKSEDLGLPTSILGPKREAKSKDMADV